MRVSNFEQYNLSSKYTSSIQNKMADQTVKITTGKEFIYPSDNPTKVNQSLLLNNTLDKLEQMNTNVNDANSFIERTESILAQVADVVQDTRENAIAANSGQFSEADREAYATVIERNIEQILGLANTKHLNRYLFSGEKTQTPPFDYDGTNVTYNGDDKNISFKIGTNQDMNISETGDVVFEDLLKSMVELRDSLKSNDPNAVSNAISSLDNGFDKVIDTRTNFGIRMKTLDLVKETYENSLVDIKAKISNVEDVDLTKVYSEYMQTTMLYQGSIQANLKMMQASILNYL